MRGAVASACFGTIGESRANLTLPDFRQRVIAISLLSHFQRGAVPMRTVGRRFIRSLQEFKQRVIGIGGQAHRSEAIRIRLISFQRQLTRARWDTPRTREASDRRSYRTWHPFQALAVRDRVKPSRPLANNLRSFPRSCFPAAQGESQSLCPKPWSYRRPSTRRRTPLSKPPSRPRSRPWLRPSR